MNLTLIFQISVYCLIALSSFMFMLAEGGLFPQLLTIPLGLITLFFTDRWRKFSLSPLWANILGLVAFLIVCREFVANIEGRLLAGAHFLVYLTWIILLQKKGDTQYWWLFALGFLQIAVGAVLTESGYYGILLVIYLFLAFWSLTVFSIYRTDKTFASQSEESLPPLPRTTVATSIASPFHRPSQVQDGIQSDQSRKWITAEFIWSSIGCSISALIISMCFFLLIPRLWVNRSFFNNETLEAEKQPLVGFAEKVQLGEMGEILESSERVLEVTIYDNQTDEAVPVMDFVRKYGMEEPLFRGAVLSTYENGSWSRFRRHTKYGLPNSRELENYGIKDLYRQEIVMESIGTNVLFVLQPVVGMDMTGKTDDLFNEDTLEIRQTDPPEMDGNTRYTVYTAKKLDENYLMNKLDLENEYLELPERDLRRLIKYTQQLIASHPELKTDEAKAKFLESHLRDSGEFSYTLNMSIVDPEIDPVEDFLFNRKSGHCEYYASSLALMLRAIKIPTRVISGFKGGDTSYLSNRFEVQQRYAHSWVEAFVNGHWETLDATPSLERAEMVAQSAASLSSWKGVSKFFSQFWTDYVIGVSFQRQKAAFYDPLLQAGKKIGKRLLDIRTTTVAMFQSVKKFLSSPRRWFSWEGAAAVFIIAGLFFGLKWLGQVLIRFFRKLFAQDQDQANKMRSAQITFYERFQKLLARKGMIRKQAETQQEFSCHVKTDLKRELTQAHLDDYPDEIARLYYQVRYGDHPLEPDQSHDVDQKLTALETILTEQEKATIKQ
ncbi:DUF3488 and DUF4129 domain-containing transglutaminase family protein [Gimesia panareensis]|nr:DUF3488 and transglutaminase-like domain-containing protein [Gimesia panareensis]